MTNGAMILAHGDKESEYEHNFQPVSRFPLWCNDEEEVHIKILKDRF